VSVNALERLFKFNDKLLIQNSYFEIQISNFEKTNIKSKNQIFDILA